MKKIIGFTFLLLLLGLSTAMAAPLNNLSKEQAAVGVANDNIYIEYKIADRITVGVQNIDVNYNDDSLDIYGQYHFTDSLRGIIGYRDFNDNSLYAGVGVTRNLDDKWDGHAYAVVGSEFWEAQVGATYMITDNLDGNVYFRSFMPNEGRDKNRLGIGLTYKF